MNTHSILSGPRRGGYTACGAAILLTLLGLVPVGTIADQPVATPTAGSVADISLSDLDLSTPEGIERARERLHAMAERVCAGRGRHQPASEPAFGVCVDSTVATALRHINALRQTDMAVRDSVTLGERVSLADLDLSTLEGERIAHKRLETMARHLCSELARRQDLSYQPDYAACVSDTLAGAWAQANVIRAANETRTAQRSAR